MKEFTNLIPTEIDGVRYLGTVENPYLILHSADYDVKELNVIHGCEIIGKKALEEHERLRRVLIPEGVKQIEFMAFYGCHSLCDVTFPSGLITVADSAFYDCNIQRLSLPDSVRYVGEDAFSISALKEVILPNEVTHIGQGAFTHNDISYNEYCGGYYLGSRQNPYLCFIKPKDKELQHFEPHEDCRIIYSNAFAKSERLSTVILPEGIFEIGKAAFRECKNLKSVKLPQTLRVIDERAFAGCEMLCDIELPKAQITIESAAFTRCTSIEKIELENAVVGDNAFDGCKNLKTVTVGERSNLYGCDIFTDCDSLKEIISLKNKENNCESKGIFI